jgi:Sensors of blue-light using FAD
MASSRASSIASMTSPTSVYREKKNCHRRRPLRKSRSQGPAKHPTLGRFDLVDVTQDCPMFSLLYVSSATVPFSKQDLQELLLKSRRNNTALEVTGLLLFKDGNFMQVLEGDERNVNAVYQRILLDSRHAGTMILLKQHTAARDFAEWSMAFRDMNDPQVRATPGFNSFLNENPDDKALFRDPTRAQRLLQFFKQSMR